MKIFTGKGAKRKLHFVRFFNELAFEKYFRTFLFDQKFGYLTKTLDFLEIKLFFQQNFLLKLIVFNL